MQLSGLFAGLVLCSVLNAGVIYSNRAAFLADPGVTTTAIIDFEVFADGTNLAGALVSGVQLLAPEAEPLSVMLASTGVHFPMSASSGEKVLSPGYNFTTRENDDLELHFAVPVRAVGLDVVFDVPDGASFSSVTVYDTLNRILAVWQVQAPNGAPGYGFAGYVSTSANIARAIFDEYDGTPSDDHVAYDTIVFSPGQAVPEPASFLLMGAGALLFALRRR